MRRRDSEQHDTPEAPWLIRYAIRASQPAEGWWATMQLGRPRKSPT
jgi:hypothetical protein